MKTDTPTAREIVDMFGRAKRRVDAARRLQALAQECPYPELQEQLKAIAEELAA